MINLAGLTNNQFEDETIENSQTISQTYDLLKNSNNVSWNDSLIKLKAPSSLNTISSVSFRSFEGSLLPYLSLSLPNLEIQLKVFMNDKFGENDYVVLRGCDNTENIKIFNKIINENYQDVSNIITEFNKAWTYNSTFNSQIEYNLKELIEYLNICLSKWLGSTSRKIKYGIDNMNFIETEIMSEFDILSKDICSDLIPMYVSKTQNRAYYFPYISSYAVAYKTIAVSTSIIPSTYSLIYANKSQYLDNIICMTYFNEVDEMIYIGPYNSISADNVITINKAILTKFRDTSKVSIFHASISSVYETASVIEIYMTDIYRTNDAIKENSEIVIYLDSNRYSFSQEIGKNILSKFTDAYDIKILDIGIRYSTSEIMFQIPFAVLKNSTDNEVYISSIRLTYDYTSSSCSFRSWYIGSISYDSAIVISLADFKAMNLNEFLNYSSSGYYNSSTYYTNGRYCLAYSNNKFIKQIFYDCYNTISDSSIAKTFIVNLDAYNGKGSYYGRLAYITNTDLFSSFAAYRAITNNTYMTDSNTKIINVFDLNTDRIHMICNSNNLINNLLHFTDEKILINNCKELKVYDNFECYAMINNSKSYPINSVDSHISTEGNLFSYDITDEASYITFPSITFNSGYFITFIPCIKTNPLYFNMSFDIPSSVSINKSSIALSSSQVLMNAVNSHVFDTLEVLIVQQYEYNSLRFRCMSFPNDDNIVLSLNENVNVSLKSMNINATNIELFCNIIDNNDEAIDLETLKKLYGKIIINIDFKS